jgi:hypothetical protein
VSANPALSLPIPCDQEEAAAQNVRDEREAAQKPDDPCGIPLCEDGVGKRCFEKLRHVWQYSFRQEKL